MNKNICIGCIAIGDYIMPLSLGTHAQRGLQYFAVAILVYVPQDTGSPKSDSMLLNGGQSRTNHSGWTTRYNYIIPGV